MSKFFSCNIYNLNSIRMSFPKGAQRLHTWALVVLSAVFIFTSI